MDAYFLSKGRLGCFTIQDMESHSESGILSDGCCCVYTYMGAAERPQIREDMS